MTDYFISNCFTFFSKGEGDLLMMLEMVERYDRPDCVSMQVKAIKTLNMLNMFVETDSLRRITDQNDAWEKAIEIINKWTEAWLIIAADSPTALYLCKDQSVLNYAKLVRE